MTPAQSEDLRWSALEVLCLRHPAALDLAGVKRRAKPLVDFDFAGADLASALHVLAGLGLVTRTADGLGSSDYYAASAAGKIHFERGRVPRG